MDIGFCGLGNMGSAMVARLSDKGHRVTVWNRTSAKAVPLAENGAVLVNSPAEVTSRNEVVLTSLFDDQAVSSVFDGPDGLLSVDCTGKLFVDTSTVSPGSTRDLAHRIRAKGASLLDCPVGGAPTMARGGNLLGLVGGAEADFVRVQPLLGDLCHRVEHVGPSGSGNAMKLAINLPLAVYFEALGEALALVKDVSIEKAVSVLSESPGAANAMKIFAPWIIEAQISGREIAQTVPIDGLRKDFRLMIDLARQMGVALPVTAAALGSFDDAVRDGWGARASWRMPLYRLGQAKECDAVPPHNE